MKMKELIDKVSVMYRTERDEVYELRQKLNSIERSLMEAKETKFENISHADYESLTTMSESLRQEIRLKTQHYEGISCVREMLMDLGFDTEIK